MLHTLPKQAPASTRNCLLVTNFSMTAVVPSNSFKSRRTIYGRGIIGARIGAEGARKRAAEAAREAAHAEAEV